MLMISKPLSASQARTDHEREFASQKQIYWSGDQRGHGEWRRSLAEQWKLAGAVEAEHFARRSEGQHAHTEQQLVRHQGSKTYEGKFGKKVTSAEHRAAWDATFSAPKSVSLTALLGGDDRVREAHRETVRVALRELERYTMSEEKAILIPEARAASCLRLVHCGGPTERNYPSPLGIAYGDFNGDGNLDIG
jgi:conjugative relaxase-like TrwC/TraI family protein